MLIYSKKEHTFRTFNFKIYLVGQYEEENNILKFWW